jgi:hypothetical protein
VPAVRFDDRASDREPEPGSAALAGSASIDPVKALEDAFEVLGRYARAVV